MNIDSLPTGNQVAQDAVKINNNELAVEDVKETAKTDLGKSKINTATKTPTSLLNTKTQFALDDATGLLQTITKDALTDKVIRKMPTDEYLHMLHVMDEIISGSIKKET